MATKAQILALSAQPFAQLGKASDTGEWYTIAPSAAGSTAKRVFTGSDGAPLPITQGGTGAITAAAALVAFGLTNGDGDIIASLLLEDVTGIVPADKALGEFEGAIHLGDGVLEAGRTIVPKSGVYKATDWDDAWHLMGTLTIPADRVVVAGSMLLEVKADLAGVSGANIAFNVRNESASSSESDLTSSAFYANGAAETHRVRYLVDLTKAGFPFYLITASGAGPAQLEVVSTSFNDVSAFSFPGSVAHVTDNDLKLDIYLYEETTGAPTSAIVRWSAQLIDQ